MATQSPVPDQAWREEYRAHRYLEFATPEVLTQRLQDLVANVYVMDRAGKFSIRPDAEKWTRLVAHIREEITLRRIALETPIPKRYLKAPAAAYLWDQIEPPYGSYLLKFGMREHMRALWETGQLRISPAETYNDPTLTKAVFDNEREFIQESISAKVHAPPRRDYTIPLSEWIEIPIIGTMKYIQTYTGQAYMACFSQRYDYRLFEDFGYDSCVVIRDQLRFWTALKEAGEVALPGWGFYFDNVKYRDPFQPTPGNDVLYTKHFRYTYQDEHRVTWERETLPDGKPLQPIFLNVGPLTDYCNLFFL